MADFLDLSDEVFPNESIPEANDNLLRDLPPEFAMVGMISDDP